MAWLRLLIRKCLTFLKLPLTVKILLGQAFLLLPLVTLSLHFQGLKTTQQRLSALSLRDPSLPPQDSLSQIQITVKVVAIASKYSKIWSNCLRKSLVLWFLLRRQGIASDIRIGVQFENKSFKAHAWVEANGLILNDSQDVVFRYAPFQRPINMS